MYECVIGEARYRCEKGVIEMKDMVCKNCMSDGEWEYVEEWVDEGKRFVLVMCIGCGREEIWKVE